MKVRVRSQNQFNYMLIVYITNDVFSHVTANPNHIFFVKYPTLSVPYSNLMCDLTANFFLNINITILNAA